MKEKALILLKLIAAVSIGLGAYRFLKYHNGLNFVDENFSYVLAVLLVLLSFIVFLKFITKLVKFTLLVLMIMILVGVGSIVYYTKKDAIKDLGSRISL